ncbi:chaperone SicP [Salmonella enterica]|nr:chaperone SicP [Salmonella enterica]EBQ4932022.1 chaperone SicP [Salmonella enterica]
MYTHEQLLSEVGNILDLTLEFDENEQCMLQFDDSFVISIKINRDVWLLTGILLNSLPSVCGEGFWRKIMTINVELAINNFGHLSYSDEDNMLLLMYTIMNLNTAHSVTGHLEKFVNLQEKLIETLQQYSPY